VKVRKLESHEISLHREIRLRAFRDAPDAFADTAAGAEARPQSYWEDLTRSVTQHGRHVMFLACEGTAVYGSVYGLRDPDSGDTVRVGGIWVDTAYRRQGTGKALLEAVTSWAREEGFSRLRLWAPVVAVGALALYRQAGFNDTGHRRTVPNRALQVMELERGLRQEAASSRL
jgi:GNAT superfamily N-acetyltransferase